VFSFLFSLSIPLFNLILPTKIMFKYWYKTVRGRIKKEEERKSVGFK